MSVARIGCVATLRCEVFDDLDGGDARLDAESKLIAAARLVWDKVVAGKGIQALEEVSAGTTRARPTATLLDVVPLSWGATYNSFRRADEFECTIPLRALPVPLESVRVLSCEVVLRHVGSDAWEEVLSSGTPPLRRADFDPDFVGVCTQIDADTTPDKTPTLKLKFQDYLGLLANKEVTQGRELDHSLPIAEAVQQFLKGTPAEGLTVQWVDRQDAQPKLADHLPRAAKKKGKNGGVPGGHARKLLDVINEACSFVGVVPTVRVDRLDLAFGGTLYEGQDRGGEARATILVSQVVESFSVHRQLLGVQSKPVQVTSYDPDSGRVFTARWPPDPKSVAPTVVEPGKPARLPPLAANIGLPGYEQLDEAILRVSVAPVANPELLPRLAQTLFLERTRQKLKVVLKTHAPWANPAAPDLDGGTLLRLRPGDNVVFGYLGESEENPLLPPEVRVLAGGASAEVISSLLRSAGVAEGVALEVGRVVERAPRTSRWRVDELHVSGGSGQSAELEIHLINFTVIDADLQGKGKPSPSTVAQRLEAVPSFVWAAQDRATIEATFQQAYADIAEAPGSDEEFEQARRRLDSAQKKALKGR